MSEQSLGCSKNVSDGFFIDNSGINHNNFGTLFGGFRAPKLSRARRISRIFPNSSIFRSGYLRAQEELEARPTCFLKLKTSSFELCKRDSRGVFAKIRKSWITPTTNRKISFHIPNNTDMNRMLRTFCAPVNRTFYANWIPTRYRFAEEGGKNMVVQHEIYEDGYFIIITRGG